MNLRHIKSGDLIEGRFYPYGYFKGKVHRNKEGLYMKLPKGAGVGYLHDADSFRKLW